MNDLDKLAVRVGKLEELVIRLAKYLKVPGKVILSDAQMMLQSAEDEGKKWEMEDGPEEGG